ncbi:Crp/Fnr family transcriptional regulator [uncultured Kordia sp.]|uniref:Crp/Fnr family transcriptional regulator n=1 Tax=uncultured Kordia sp. TaxID=507699 RepID=UPI00261C35E3|nr:Crp/Fnr family transcriptional regulator [uncultured Kordia sp.]
MSALVEIAKFFETEHPLNQEGLQELFAAFSIKTYEKGAIILEEQQEENYLRFLNSGILREYYATEAKEININFYTKPQFITDLLAFNNDLPTRKFQECLSNVELLIVDKTTFRAHLEKYSCGKDFVKDAFQKLFRQRELLEYNRITKTPEDLYKELLIYKSSWLEKIPQYHIASYLNITPETLSRIRKRIS